MRGVIRSFVFLGAVSLALAPGCGRETAPTAPDSSGPQPISAPPPHLQQEPASGSSGGLQSFPEPKLNPDFAALHDSVPVPKQSPDVFPNQVGNWWKYQRIDSVRAIFDTVLVEIVDTLTLDHGFFTRVWTYTSSLGVDTEYVAVTNNGGIDSVSFYGARTSAWPARMFLMPLGVEGSWRSLDPNIGITDNSSYQLADEIVTPAGTFIGAFTVYRYQQDWFWVHEWWTWTSLAPRVGMVQRYHLHVISDSGPPTLEEREVLLLLDYSVRPF